MNQICEDEFQAAIRPKRPSRLPKARRNPSINSNTISMSTLKYAIIALVSLAILVTCVLFSIVGVFTLQKCPFNQNLPVYLLVFGLAGMLRLFLFLTCSYNFSKSVLVKMYEHLIWRLIINRFKSSYHYSIESTLYISNVRLKKYDYDEIETVEPVQNDQFSISPEVRINRLFCCWRFVFRFICCGCLCFKEYFNKLNNTDSLEKEEDRIHADHKYIKNASKDNKDDEMCQSSSLFIVSESTGSSSDSMQGSKSYSNISGITSTIIINDLSCINFIKTINGANNTSMSNSTPLTSRNSAPFNESIEISLELRNALAHKTIQHTSTSVENTTSGETKKQKHIDFSLGSTTAIYGNRYFNGKYGNKYGTHKRLRKHHNKTHRPIRLLDLRTIRYCITYLLQRLLDVFVISWFVCGNYWIFNPDLTDESGRDISLNTTNASFISARYLFIESLFKVTIGKKSLKMEYTTENLLCYHVSLFQIFSIYGLMTSLVVVLIPYQLYLVLRCEKESQAYL